MSEHPYDVSTYWHDRAKAAEAEVRDLRAKVAAVEAVIYDPKVYAGSIRDRVAEALAGGAQWTPTSAPAEAVAKVQKVLGCREIHAGSRPCAVHWAEWSGRGCSVAAAAADAVAATFAAERDAALAEASRLRGQIDTDGCAACGSGTGLCRDCEADAALASVGRTEPGLTPAVGQAIKDAIDESDRQDYAAWLGRTEPEGAGA